MDDPWEKSPLEIKFKGYEGESSILFSVENNGPLTIISSICIEFESIPGIKSIVPSIFKKVGDEILELTSELTIEEGEIIKCQLLLTESIKYTYDIDCSHNIEGKKKTWYQKIMVCVSNYR